MADHFKWISNETTATVFIEGVYLQCVSAVSWSVQKHNTLSLGGSKGIVGSGLDLAMATAVFYIRSLRGSCND